MPTKDAQSRPTCLHSRVSTYAKGCASRRSPLPKHTRFQRGNSQLRKDELKSDGDLHTLRMWGRHYSLGKRVSKIDRYFEKIPQGLTPGFDGDTRKPKPWRERLNTAVAPCGSSILAGR